MLNDMCTYAHSYNELHAWNLIKKEMEQQQTLQGTYVLVYNKIKVSS